MKQAQEWQTVLELAQPKRQTLTVPPHAPPQSSPLQRRAKGACLHLRLQKSLDSMTLSVFLKERPVCRFSGFCDGPWTVGEIELAWENYYILQGHKPTVTCKACGFKKLCILTSFTPTDVPPSPPSPPPSWCWAPEISLARRLRGCKRTVG